VYGDGREVKKAAVTGLACAVVCATGFAKAQNAGPPNAAEKHGQLPPAAVAPIAKPPPKDSNGSGVPSATMAGDSSANIGTRGQDGSAPTAGAPEKIELEEDEPPPPPPPGKPKHDDVAPPISSGVPIAARNSEGLGMPPPEQEESEPFASEKTRLGRHFHNGFYLQMALGLGYLGATASEGGEDLSIDGGAVTGSLWIGGSLVPGFVLGVGTLSTIAVSPHLTYTNANDASLNRTGSSDLSLHLQMFGLVSDIYPDPRSGLHFQAMLGYAVLSATQNGQSTSTNDPTGLGLMGGIGYDFWVSNEWSVGVLARVAYAATKFDDTGANVGIPTTAPGLLATFTYN
jgi:hypothetical protein